MCDNGQRKPARWVLEPGSFAVCNLRSTIRRRNGRFAPLRRPSLVEPEGRGWCDKGGAGHVVGAPRAPSDGRTAGSERIELRPPPFGPPGAPSGTGRSGPSRYVVVPSSVGAPTAPGAAARGLGPAPRSSSPSVDHLCVDPEPGRLVESACSRAGVTQLAECHLPKVDVAGSNPVSRSTPLFRSRAQP